MYEHSRHRYLGIILDRNRIFELLVGFPQRIIFCKLLNPQRCAISQLVYFDKNNNLFLTNCFDHLQLIAFSFLSPAATVIISLTPIRFFPWSHLNCLKASWKRFSHLKYVGNSIFGCYCFPYYQLDRHSSQKNNPFLACTQAVTFSQTTPSTTILDRNSKLDTISPTVRYRFRC